MDTETIFIVLGVALPILIGCILVIVAIRLSASKKADPANGSERSAAGPPPIRSAPPVVTASAPRTARTATPAPRTAAPVHGSMARVPGATARTPGGPAREQRPVALLYSAFPDHSLRNCPYCGCENAAALQFCDACGELLK